MASPTDAPPDPDTNQEAPQASDDAPNENEQVQPSENADDNHEDGDGLEREEADEAGEKHVFDDDIEMADVAQSEAVDKPVQPNDQSGEELEVDFGLEDTLFSSIYTTPACVPGLVAPWMTHIQTNGPAAVASILSLVVSISRPIESPPEDTILPNHVIANQPKATVAHVRDVIASDVHGRVLITGKDTASKRVRRAYEDFWRRIAAEATDVVLYDTDCFDTLISWLDAMASSPSRSLRLAATLGAYRMVDGFVEKGNKLRKQLASMQRQLNTEKRRCGVDDKRKKAGKELSKKGKELVKKVDVLTANNSELVVLADKVFRTVFVVKYRDVSADIRNVSVAALGGWILSFPDHFLDDSNNKYIGWLLSDKDPVVRKSSLEALLRMLKKKDFFPSLELFLKRFSHRIVEMTRDKDDHVSVGAITLLTALIEHGIVQGDACEQVCGTAIEEPHAEIRRAAGEFMARLIVSHYGQEKPASQPKRGRSARTSDGIFNPGLGEIPSPELSREYLKELLFAVLRNVDEPSTPFLAVDSVWDSFPAVRCWQAFSDLLWDHTEPPPAKGKGKGSRKGKTTAAEDEEGLNDFDKSILCEMLLASATEASGNGDAVRARLVEKGERLHPEPPAVLLSQHFLPILPKLLGQFQTDLRALRSLVKLPVHFSPKVFDQDGHDTHFTELLAKIIDILTRNTGSPEVSAACAESLRSLLCDQNPLRQHTITALQTGCTEAAKELAIQVRSNITEAQPEGLASAILRVRILSELVDPGSSVEESVLKLFEYQVEQAETYDHGDEVTLDVARTACALTIWSLARVRSRLETFVQPASRLADIQDLEEVKDLHRLGSSVVDLLHRAFSSSSLAIFPRVKLLQAFLTMSTLASGIEKQALSSSENENHTSDEHQSQSNDLDLLGIQGNATVLVNGLKTCITQLLLHQLGLKDRSRPPNQKQPHALSDEDVRNCFASLVQASFQSPFSNDISHFPLLGLLLKFSAKDAELAATEFTAFQLCRKYCQQRQLRESSLIKDEVRALHEVAGFDIEEEKRHSFVRELSEALMSSRQHAELKITAAQDLLQSLMDAAAASGEDQLAINVELLSIVGFPLCSHLSEAHAAGVLDKAKEIKKEVDEKLVDEESAEVARLFDTFHVALESVANGETPEIPKPKTKSILQRRRKKTKKRRRTTTSAAKQTQSPSVGTQGVRRSSREKRRVNYARMQALPTESEGESDDADSSENDEEETQETSPPNAAEMARDLMRYTSSPRTPARDAPVSLKNARNPKKRGRTSKERNTLLAQSPGKSVSDSPRRNEAANGVRRSPRSRRSSAKALASQESEDAPTTPRRGKNQVTETGNGAMQTGEKQGVTDDTEAVENLPTTSSATPGNSDHQGPEGGSDIVVPAQDATGSAGADEEKEPSIEHDGPTESSVEQDAQPKEDAEPADGQTSSAEQNGLQEEQSTADGTSSSVPNPEAGSEQDPGSRNQVAASGASIQQSPRRSQRRKSGASTKSPTNSRSPTKGRVEKSPAKRKVGQSSNFSQANKENVNGTPPSKDDASKLSKIRRRRRRQW